MPTEPTPTPILGRRRFLGTTLMALVGGRLGLFGTVAGQLNAAPGRITYRFHARDVHLMMGSAEQNAPVRFRVRLDGKSPGAAHGVDTDANGDGIVREQRLYQLIRQPGPIGDRLFEIAFLDPGAEAFAFTFG